MNSDQTLSFPTLSDDVFDALPKSIRSYIRYLETTIQHVIVTHAPASCHGCGSNLGHVDGACAEKRQVFDIPQPKVEVTEHQALQKQCPCCGKLNRGVFPENIKGPIQYGDRVQALTAYFSHQHF